METGKENADSSQNIDVTKIIEEIRAEIKLKGYTNDMLSFSDISIKSSDIFDSDFFDDKFVEMNRKWEVLYYRPIADNAVKSFFKKAIRKLIKPIMFPIVTEQLEFNVSVVQVLNQIRLYMEKEAKEKDNLLKRVEDLEAKLKEK